MPFSLSKISDENKFFAGELGLLRHKYIHLASRQAFIQANKTTQPDIPLLTGGDGNRLREAAITSLPCDYG